MYPFKGFSKALATPGTGKGFLIDRLMNRSSSEKPQRSWSLFRVRLVFDWMAVRLPYAKVLQEPCPKAYLCWKGIYRMSACLVGPWEAYVLVCRYWFQRNALCPEVLRGMVAMSHVETSLVKLNALMDLITCCASWGSFILIHFCLLAVAVQDLLSRQKLFSDVFSMA